jgi:hypothetical protein
LPQSLVSKPEDKTIQGSQATSIEYHVAIALDRLEIPYLFQFEIGGGRVFRGGMVLDFLALTTPLSTPIDVRGEYWHQPRQRIEDDLQLALMNHYGRGYFAQPVVLYGASLQTPEQAYSTVKRELRV